MAMSSRWARAIFCAAALVVLLSNGAYSSVPESMAQDDDEIEILSENSCVTTACPAPDAIPLPVFVPRLAPGLEFSGGWLYLKPGADNLGFATTTTFLPLQNPQWAVQTLNPSYQSGFTAGARYVFLSPGKDIRFNWEHLATGNATVTAVSNPATQWISPFNQTGPSTSENANEVGIFTLKRRREVWAFNTTWRTWMWGRPSTLVPALKCAFSRA
jgi:hypothetical protein